MKTGARAVTHSCSIARATQLVQGLVAASHVQRPCLACCPMQADAYGRGTSKPSYETTWTGVSGEAVGTGNLLQEDP
jgi:hypothetical protein